MTRNLASTDLKRLHRTWRRVAPGRVALLLDSVATPANVGSLLRTAAALRIDDVWVCGQTAAPELPGTQRTAMGSDRFVTIHRTESPTAAADQARAAGYRVIGIELAEGAKALHDTDLSGSVCMALGHEDRGISKGLLETLDGLAFIPQLGKIGSLNVAVAGAIACYEARRQGWPENSPE